MNGKKIASFALVVIGIVVVVLSLGADSIWTGRSPGFGTNQTLGTIVGALLFVVGLILRRRGQAPSSFDKNEKNRR